MSSPRKALQGPVIALSAIAIILATALGTILIQPQLISRSVTQISTFTTTATATSIQTLTSTVTSLAQTTTTSTATSIITSVSSNPVSTSIVTKTVATFGTPIGVITAANITIGKLDYRFGSRFSGTDVAADDNSNRIYVAGGSGITVINGDNNSIVTTIPIRGGSTVVAVNPQTNRIYANNDTCTSKCMQSIFIINGTSNRVIGNINLGQYVDRIAVNDLTNTVYATSFGFPASLFVINGSTNAIAANISVPASPQGFPTFMAGLAVNQFTNMVYVAAGVASLVFDTTIYAINGTTNSIVAKIPLGGDGLQAMAVDYFTKTIYITTGNVLVSINGNTYAVTSAPVSALPLGCGGLAVFFGEIYLACSPRQNIPSFIIMDGSGRIINSFTQDGSPIGVAVYSGIGSAGVYIVYQNGYVLSVLWSRFGYP